MPYHVVIEFEDEYNATKFADEVEEFNNVLVADDREDNPIELEAFFVAIHEVTRSAVKPTMINLVNSVDSLEPDSLEPDVLEPSE